MQTAKENPQSLRAWHGHEWHCQQCSTATPRDFDVRGMSLSQLADYCQQTKYDGLCEHGSGLKKASDEVLEAVKLLGSNRRKVSGPEIGWKPVAFDPRKYILPAKSGQKEFLVSMLTGSQAKTAFALRMNAEKMCLEGGIESIGFLTLTVGDYHCQWHGKQRPREHNTCPKCQVEMKFIQVYDSTEASRRINNLNRRVIGVLFEKAICVTERMKSEAIHFHLLGILSGRPDIRTGLDFDAVKARDYQTASPSLRRLWGRLRAVLPGYGFGRAELLPVKKTGEAVSSYISKYIEKNVANRLKDDAHKKLVRYIGWGKTQLKPNEFEWNGEKSKAWRAKTREILGTVFCEIPDKRIEPEKRIKDFCIQAENKIRPKLLDGSQAKEAFGPKWAFHVNRIRSVFDTTETTPFLIWDYRDRQFVKKELYRIAPAWCKRRESERRLFSDEMIAVRQMIYDYDAALSKYACILNPDNAKN